MYIFEFTHTLTQQDLSDIWQNLPPDIGTEMEVSEVAITHPLLRKELLGQGGESGNATIEMPDKLKWMVFKVKQRAASNYFKKTILRNPEVNTDVGSGNVTKDEFGDTSNIQYNWPYDFFSLVEMVKIDAEVELGNIDFSNYTDNIPAWDVVMADRDKIAQVVGGLEDEPIPETQAQEEAEEEGNDTNLGDGAEMGGGFWDPLTSNIPLEGLYDGLPPPYSSMVSSAYIYLKVLFGGLAAEDPLGNFFDLWSVALDRYANQDIYAPLETTLERRAKLVSENWFNRDENQAQRRAEATAGQENAQQVMEDASWRAMVKSQFRDLYEQYDTVFRSKSKAKQKAWADILRMYSSNELWTNSFEIEVYNSIDTGGNASVTLE